MEGKEWDLHLVVRGVYLNVSACLMEGGDQNRREKERFDIIVASAFGQGIVTLEAPPISKFLEE